MYEIVNVIIFGTLVTHVANPQACVRISRMLYSTLIFGATSDTLHAGNKLVELCLGLAVFLLGFLWNRKGSACHGKYTPCHVGRQ